MADGACWLAFPLSSASSGQQLEFLSVAHRHVWRISPEGKWDCLRVNQPILSLDALYAGFASMEGLLMGQSIPTPPVLLAAQSHDWPLDCQICLVTAIAFCLADISKAWLQRLGVASMTPAKWTQISDSLLLRTIDSARPRFIWFFSKFDREIVDCLLLHIGSPGRISYAELWDFANRTKVARSQLLQYVADIADDAARAENLAGGCVPEIIGGRTDTVADNAPIALGLGYQACTLDMQGIRRLPPSVLHDVGRNRFGLAPGRRFVLLIRHADTARNCMLVELQKTKGRAGGIPRLLRYIMLDHPPSAGIDAFLLAQLLRRLVGHD